MSSDTFNVFHRDGVKSFNVLLPELMSNLLHNLPGIAYRCRNDSKWTMLFLSEGCFKLTGYHPGDLLYNSERSYDDLILEEDRDYVRNSVNEAVKERRQFKMTYRIMDFNGNVKWVWEQGNAIYDKENHPYYLDGFIADVTEKVAAEDALAESAAQLKELNTMKDKFFSTIAHDLQNPIYAIISLSDFISQNAINFKPHELVDFIHQINASAKSAHTLLENLLDWARMQTGRLRIQKERLNIPKLIDDCITLNSAQAHQKSIKFVRKMPSEHYVESDYNLLSTVFRNLIANAVKFSHHESEVILQVESIDNKTCISVLDKGIGISRANISKLGKIDGDFRHLGTDNEPGTGLGLILVKEFLDRLGGSLEISSRVNQGSKFCVWL